MGRCPWPGSVHRTQSVFPTNIPTPMARTFPDFHILPQLILRYVRKLNPPVLLATSHSRGPSFPQTQRLQRFKLSFQFKNRMFLKASLAGQIYQSGCKKFHFHVGIKHINSGPEKQGALVPDSEPYAHASNRQFLKLCSHHFMSHALLSLAMGHSHLCAPPEQHGGYSNASTTAP